MVVQRINEFGWSAPIETVRADDKHLILANRLIQSVLILDEIRPGPLVKPGRIASRSDPGVTVGQGFVELVHPSLEDPQRIESALFEVPVGVCKDLDLSFFEVLVKIWDSLFHCSFGLLLTEGIAGNPHTKFIVLQSGLEVWNENVNQIVFGFIKQAEMRAPGHLPQ